MRQRILVVHDNPDCRDALRASLQTNGFDVAVLYEPSRLLERLGIEPPAMVVMKAGPSVAGGMAALKALRAANHDVPVLMLGGHDDVIERVLALESGADDIVSLPYNPLEILVRIRNVLKRAERDLLQNPRSHPPFRFGQFELCFVSRTLSRSGTRVPLPEAEFAMLNLFVNAPGRVLSREFIAQRMYPEASLSGSVVGLWVHRLRRRIEIDVAHPQFIRTIRSRGYVFYPPASDDAHYDLNTVPQRMLQTPSHFHASSPTR